MRNSCSPTQSIYFCYSCYFCRESFTCGLLNSYRARKQLKSSGIQCFFLNLSSFTIFYITLYIEPYSLMNLYAFTGPICEILVVQSQPHKMQKSTNSFWLSFIFYKRYFLGIYMEGLSRVKSLIRLVAPKAKVSKSSEITPSAKSFFVNHAHCASAYPQDLTVGMPESQKKIPIKPNIVIVSSIYSFDILTLLLLCFAAYNKSPYYNAYSDFTYAAYFRFFLRFSYESFYDGGIPSNTQIGFIPTSIQSKALYIIPIKCPVWFPWESIGILTLELELASLRAAYLWSQLKIYKWLMDCRLLIFCSYNAKVSND